MDFKKKKARFELTSKRLFMLIVFASNQNQLNTRVGNTRQKRVFSRHLEPLLGLT